MPTVLVVDDEPIVREVVCSYLQREGYRTLEAADGDRARELLESSSPALVVLDLMLPGTDGLELCRWIRRRSELPVIMLGPAVRRPTGSWGWSSGGRLRHEAVLAPRARRARAHGATPRRPS